MPAATAVATNRGSLPATASSIAWPTCWRYWTPPTPIARMSWAIRWAVGQRSQDLTQLRGLLAAGMERWCLVLEHSLGELSAAWRARARRNDLAALSAVVADDRADQSKALAEALATVTVPIRWIVGELDPAREAVSRAAAATSRGDLVVVPGKNHFQTFASAVFADAVAEFLLHD
jgi:pimeloyl-ACP methyl ester carboxylesterase